MTKPKHIEERKFKRCEVCGAILNTDETCPICDKVDGQENR